MEFYKGKERVTVNLTKQVWRRASALRQHRDSFPARIVEKLCLDGSLERHQSYSILIPDARNLVKWPTEVCLLRTGKAGKSRSVFQLPRANLPKPKSGSGYQVVPKARRIRRESEQVKTWVVRTCSLRAGICTSVSPETAG